MFIFVLSHPFNSHTIYSEQIWNSTGIFPEIDQHFLCSHYIKIKPVIFVPGPESFNLSKIQSELDRSSIAVSSEYFTTGVVSRPVQSFVYKVSRTGDRMVPCGEPVEVE